LCGSVISDKEKEILARHISGAVREVRTQRCYFKMAVVYFQFVLVCGNYIIVNGNVLMPPRELFDRVPIEPDTKFKLATISAATCGNGHQHRMKVTDWEMYLRVTHVLLNLIFVYTHYFVSCSV